MANYHWDKTEKIVRNLGEIEVMQRVFAILPHVKIVEERLLRRSLLKSAVYSAKIEGIITSESEPKAEAQNLLQVYERIFGGQLDEVFSVELIKKLHSGVMRNLSTEVGRLRRESWAIFNQAGVAIYVAPPHFRLEKLMAELVEEINSLNDHPAEVAAVTQFRLEKIHPFADGNGRVGRLVSAFWLQKFGYGFRGLLGLEEYMEKHREEYYAALTPSHNMTEFVEYVLEAIVVQVKAVVERLKQPVEEEVGVVLSPRREEIMSIISEHKRCSFDFIERRFLSVNPKTMHYDIGWLVKNRYIRKVGVTRGVVYEVVD